MKMLLLALATLLILAGPASAPHGQHPTSLALDVPALRVGDEAVLSALLRDDQGGTVAGVEVVFEVETTYGWLELGRATTNARGKASLLYTPTGPGSYTFRGRFEGNSNWTASGLEVQVTIEDTAPRVPFATSTAIAFVVAIVVGSIWGAYLFVLLELRQVWTEGGGTPFLKKQKEVRTK